MQVQANLFNVDINQTKTPILNSQIHKMFFSVPYRIVSETYVWPFQYRILNFILFTNDKLFKMGLSDSDKCSFCGTCSEDLNGRFVRFVRFVCILG